MTAVNFCYWLQDFFEITDHKSGRLQELDAKQVETIQRHLNLVFVHDIDPKAGGPEVQKKLDEIHAPNTTSAGHIARC